MTPTLLSILFPIYIGNNEALGHFQRARMAYDPKFVWYEYDALVTSPTSFRFEVYGMDHTHLMRPLTRAETAPIGGRGMSAPNHN